jgi:hypothetical protein
VIHRLRAIAALALTTWQTAGCAIGYTQALFATTSNVGVDIDTKPPTFEVSVARREGVIEPTFEGGQTPPTLATFSTGTGTGMDRATNAVGGFFFGVSAFFAGGDAARVLAGPDGKPGDSAICLSKGPHRRGWLTNELESGSGFLDAVLPGPGEMKPFFFATDTALGIKLAWSGTTGYVPDTVKVGFNRREFALAPISWAHASCTLPTGEAGTLQVEIPSFIAVLSSGAETPKDRIAARFQYLQHLATGAAATDWAARPEVKKILESRLEPELPKNAASSE